jgi:hypothetical protein
MLGEMASLLEMRTETSTPLENLEEPCKLNAKFLALASANGTEVRSQARIRSSTLADP